MKNHKYVNGQLLQTNKKWSHLKVKQRNWIYTITKQEYQKYILNHNKLPIKKKKHEIFDNVYEKVNKRNIWIPYYEFKIHVNKLIDKLNKETNIFENNTDINQSEELIKDNCNV